MKAEQYSSIRSIPSLYNDDSTDNRRGKKKFCCWNWKGSRLIRPCRGRWEPTRLRGSGKSLTSSNRSRWEMARKEVVAFTPRSSILFVDIGLHFENFRQRSRKADNIRDLDDPELSRRRRISFLFILVCCPIVVSQHTVMSRKSFF